MREVPPGGRLPRHGSRLALVAAAGAVIAILVVFSWLMGTIYPPGW
jgi:hypothetical protein